MRAKLATAVAAAVLAATSASAFAQTRYPARPIRVIVPYPPGGITDVATRMVTQEISKTLGQNIIVDNRPGANSILGVDIAAKSAPDSAPGHREILRLSHRDGLRQPAAPTTGARKWQRR